MELRYSFDELFPRETKECIQKGSKYELKFKKLNAPMKEFISIENDGFNDFIKARGIGKRSKAKSFQKAKISVDAVMKKLHEDIK